jgi:hypothetical protein
MKNYNYGFKYFFKPTPKNIARLGMSLFLTCSTVAGTFAYFGESKVAMFIGILGASGLFLSNFFGNGNQGNQENIQ